MSDRRVSPIDAWRQFIQTGEVAASVREPISNSWRRSKDAGIDPNMAVLPRLLPEDLERRRGSNTELNRGIAQTVKDLEQHLAGSGVMICVFDTQGYLLNTAGDRSVIGFAAGIGLGPGTCLGEGAAGTNSVALVIATGQPSQCSSPEHYCLRLHHLNDAAAPIFSRGAVLAGVLALFGMASGSHAQHLLALAMTAARSSQIQNRARRQGEWLKQYRQTVVDLFGASSMAMAVVSPRGYIKQISPAALRLLNISSAKDLDKPIDKIVGLSPPLVERLSDGKEFKGDRVEVTTKAGSFASRIDGTVLCDLLGQRLGTLIVFHGWEPLTGPTETDRPPSAKFSFSDIVGESEAIVAARESAMKAAGTSVSVLLEGESGTGKEMFAQAIHNASDRRNGPFVAVNCAAIPSELIESELFGYSPGAFTGARREGMTGKFEAAHGGTIFLDEICETPLPMQSEILRVLENRTIVRVGDYEEVPVDIRIIAATNRKLIEEVEKGNLREDLYYRLSVTKITLPSLEERTSDIPTLVESFVEQFNHEMGRSVKKVSEQVLEALMSYHWAGNVRELRNTIEHAVMVAGGETIEWDHLPDELRQSLLYRGVISATRNDPLLDRKKGLEKIARDLETGSKELYLRALELANGNRSRAAEILGVGRSTFYRKLAAIEAGESGAGPEILDKHKETIENSTRDLYLQALRLAGGNIKRAADLIGVGRSTFYRKIAAFRISSRDLDAVRRQGL